MENASMQKILTRGTFVILTVLAVLPAAPAAAITVNLDAVTVGSGAAAPGTTIDLPISIRDLSGTPLGVDQPPGSKIQSYSIKVDYAPAAAVQSVTITRGGITTSLTPTFESTPSGAGTISILDTFQESTNPIPFTLNAAAPGNTVAVLHVTLSPSATAGTSITLALDPVLTQLTDQAGSGATKESVGNANLLLVNGAINVIAPVPALSTWALMLLASSLAAVALRMRS
jgi:hypothetical protein